MRLIGYVRVSTRDQVERYGPREQERDIRTWCQTHGHELLAIKREQASGKRGTAGADGYGLDNGPSTRPVLSKVLAAVEAGKADGIVVGRSDRLARSVMWQEVITHKLEAKGRHVFVVGAHADGLDPMTRTLLRQVLAAVGEYEHAMIAARLQGGRRAKAERGGFAYGSAPFGQVSHRPTPKAPSVLKPNKAEQATIARMRELRAQRGPDGQPLSFHTIAKQLNAEGHRTKRGKSWHQSTVHRVLTREGAA